MKAGAPALPAEPRDEAVIRRNDGIGKFPFGFLKL